MKRCKSKHTWISAIFEAQELGFDEWSDAKVSVQNIPRHFIAHPSKQIQIQIYIQMQIQTELQKDVSAICSEPNYCPLLHTGYFHKYFSQIL